MASEGIRAARVGHPRSRRAGEAAAISAARLWWRSSKASGGAEARARGGGAPALALALALALARDSGGSPGRRRPSAPRPPWRPGLSRRASRPRGGPTDAGSRSPRGSPRRRPSRGRRRSLAGARGGMASPPGGASVASALGFGTDGGAGSAPAGRGCVSWRRPHRQRPLPGRRSPPPSRRPWPTLLAAGRADSVAWRPLGRLPSDLGSSRRA